MFHKEKLSQKNCTHSWVPCLCENCRYVLAVATIAAAYGIVQLPFAIYYSVHQKRLIRDGYLPDFDFYGDKVLPFNYLTYIHTHNIETM